MVLVVTVSEAGFGGKNGNIVLGSVYFVFDGHFISEKDIFCDLP